MIVEPVQPIRKKLPGRPVAKSTLIAEHKQFWADIAARSDFAAAYAEFFAPPPESVHQWRMQLDCGCIRGQLTRDADELPGTAARIGDI